VKKPAPAKPKVDVVVNRKQDRDLEKFEGSLKQLSENLLEILIILFRDDNHNQLRGLFVVDSGISHQAKLNEYLRQLVWLHDVAKKSNRYKNMNMPAPNQKN
jgi:hypothetical protein